MRSEEGSSSPSDKIKLKFTASALCSSASAHQKPRGNFTETRLTQMQNITY